MFNACKFNIEFHRVNVFILIYDHSIDNQLIMVELKLKIRIVQLVAEFKSPKHVFRVLNVENKKAKVKPLTET